MAPDTKYLDDYEVWISTDTNTVASFTQSGTKLLSKKGNAGEMKSEFINLTAYAGQDVYIASRNVANDKFLLYIDNIKISVYANDDTKLEKATHNRLSLVNVNNPITYSVFNKGSNTITSIRIKYSDGTTDVEEGTGTWCGWCPGVAVTMDMMYENHPSNFIGIAVHNNDPMANSAYDNGAGFSAFPGCNVDRVILGGDVEKMEVFFNQRKNALTVTKVEGDVTSNGTSVTINAKARFNTIVTNNKFRLGVVLVEDNVSGTTSKYAQANYYSGGGSGAMGGYENLPDPVPADQMVYDHVGRGLLGGYNGQANSVPTTVDETTIATYTFNYTIPASYNKNNMYVVILLIDTETGEIYNAAKYPLAVAATNDLETINALAVYPNPSTDMLNVELDATVADYTVTVYDLSGKQLIQKSVNGNAGVQKTTLDVSTLAKGSYIVSVATAGQSYSKHFVKN